MEPDLTRPLPPPLPGTAVLLTADRRRPSAAPTLPVVAAVGAVLVLTASLVASKYLLDVVIDFQWPIAAYVALLAVVGYAPSVWWCRYASRRWGTGGLGHDIGLRPQWSDLGWGPVVWLGALGAQVAAAAVVVALGPTDLEQHRSDQRGVDRSNVRRVARHHRRDRRADRGGDGVSWRRAARTAQPFACGPRRRRPGAAVRGSSCRSRPWHRQRRPRHGAVGRGDRIRHRELICCAVSARRSSPMRSSTPRCSSSC